MTPAPWVNVLANPHFGTVISENGMAYTWSENAHEFRLTPWGNDPVSDASGEAFYLRDEESGHFWSPTPLPSRGATPYVSRHGFGYSSFEHAEDGISSELTVYVALDAAVKFSVLKVRNESGRARRLSATGYVEWVLGDLRPKSTMHVITEIDPVSGAFYARNAYNTEFADRIAFFDVDDIADPDLQRRPRRVHRAQRHAQESGGHDARRNFPTRWEPLWIPARQSRLRSSWPTGKSVSSSSGSAPGATSTMRASCCSAAAARRRRTTRWKKCGNTGSTRWAQCRWKHPISRSTC